MEGKKSSFWMPLLGGGAVLGIVAVLGVLLLAGGDDQKAGAGTKSATGANGVPQFNLRYPDSWKVMDKQTAAKIGNEPTVALQRGTKTGILTMKIRGPVKEDLSTLEKQVVAQIEKRNRGVDMIDSGPVDTRAGKGLYMTWSTAEGALHSNLVVPAGKHSFTLDAVVPGGNKKAAEEVGLMFSAFEAGK